MRICWIRFSWFRRNFIDAVQILDIIIADGISTAEELERNIITNATTNIEPILILIKAYKETGTMTTVSSFHKGTKRWLNAVLYKSLKSCNVL